MGLEDAPQRAVNVPMGPLVTSAEPVVTPNAVAALSDAFRKGIVTSEDIISRFGELGKKKEKAELMSLNEAMSPEAVAARQQATATQTATGALGQAQAEAALPNVPAQAGVQKQELELKSAELRHGPAIKYFQAYAPEAGISAPPVKPDGSPDYNEMARVGAQLYAWKTEKELAKERLEPATWKEGTQNGQKILLKFNKRGELITPELEQGLNQKILKPFSGIAAGEAQVAPTATAAPVVAPRSAYVPSFQATTGDQARAQLTSAGLGDIITGTDEDLRRAGIEFSKPVVQPMATASQPVIQPATSAIGQPVAGAGISLGTTTEGVKAPTEAQQRAQLALSRFAQSNDMFAALRDAGYDPTTTVSWINGMLPEVLKSGDRKAYDSAVNAWSQGLLRLESGAAISRQEKTWYDKAFFPQVADPPSVVASKDAMRHDIERMVAEIAQAGGVVSPESAATAKTIFSQADQFAKGAVAPSAAGNAPKSGPVVTLSSGKKVQKGANGQYQLVP